MYEITLDENHIYRVDGIETPGVTTVIENASLMGYLTDDEYYLERGQYIHAALELYMSDNLDFDSLSDGIKGYVESGILYISQTGYKPSHTEIMLCDPVYGYCGKPDGIPLRDWKSGGKEDWHIIQMAAYNNLLKVNKIPCGLPLNVHLKKDGKMPKVEPYTQVQLRDAFKVFASALITYKWRKEHELL